ncbi:MAG: hypothetical protein ACRELY_21015, partial [Polyangiaceae bacterium]
HIQTEDSGVKHQHVITHLFMDGGRILKSVKASYAEHVGADGMSETVKQMMKAQHKAMFIALRDGQFDHLVDAGAAASAPALPPAPPSQPEPPPHGHANTVPAPPPSSASEVNLPPPPRMRPAAATIPDDPPISASPQTTREELTLDFAALERASRAPPSMPPPSSSSRDLPPPPPNLMRRLEPQKVAPDPGTGRHRTLKREEPESEPAIRVATPVPPPKPASQRPRKGATPKPPKPRSERPPPQAQPQAQPHAQSHESGQGRYAPSRPAAIFGQARPQQSSIFGEDLISDKSLDEVILSYLAEDLSGDAKK